MKKITFLLSFLLCVFFVSISLAQIASSQTTTYDGLGLSDTAIITNGTVIDNASYDGWRFNGFGGETGIYAHDGSLTNDVNTTSTRIYTSDGSNFKCTSIDYVIDTFGSPANATITFYGFRDGVQVESQVFNAADTSSGTWTLNWNSVDEIKIAANTNFIFMDNLKLDAEIPPSDTTAPVFENSTPSSASVAGTGFILNTDIDEAGTIYYVVVPDGATAPTSIDVKDGDAGGCGGEILITKGNAAVTTGGFTNAFSVTGLTSETAYDIYVVAQDDEGSPNLQTSPTKIDVTTTDVTAPGFDSTPTASFLEDLYFRLNIDLNEAGDVYYVIVADAASAPSSAQVKAGQNSTGSSALFSGTKAFTTAAGNFDVSVLTPATAYDIYIVTEDSSSNLSASPTKVDVTTAAASTNYRWTSVTAPSVGTLQETVNGVTVTVTSTATGGVVTSNFNNTSGTVFTTIGAAAAGSSVTFTFDSPIDITSINAFEFGGETWDFTPTGGSNSLVSEALTNAGSNIVDLNWVSVTSFTVTVNGGGTAQFFFDEMVASEADVTAPTYNSAGSTPNDNATGVATANDIVVDFSENIAAGTGNITVRDVTGASNFEVFAITGATATSSPTAGNIGILNDKLYINPTNELTGSNNYSIRIDATAIDDASGNSFAGITDDVTFNFTTGVAPLLIAAWDFSNSVGALGGIPGGPPSYPEFTDVPVSGILKATPDGANDAGVNITAEIDLTDFSNPGTADATVNNTISTRTTSNLLDNGSTVSVQGADRTMEITIDVGAGRQMYDLVITYASKGSGGVIHWSGPSSFSQGIGVTSTSFISNTVSTILPGEGSAQQNVSITAAFLETWTIDNLQIYGKLRITPDTTAPVFENSTPSSSNITSTGFTLSTDIDEAGTIYYVVVADGATAPTSLDVKNGDGGTCGGIVEASGNLAVSTGGFTHDFSVTGLNANTAYDVYVVAQDDEGVPNLQGNPTKIDVMTIPLDTTPPVFENSTPSSSSIAQKSFTLSTDIDEAGTIYYVVVVDGAIAPTSVEVKAGTGNGGSGEITTGNAVVNTGGFTHDFSVSGLTVNTAYDVYVVAEDTAGNLQVSPTKIDVATVNTPPTFTSTPITTIDEGDMYSYAITTNDVDSDNVGITAPTLPSWLSLATNREVSTLAGSGVNGITNGTGAAASFTDPSGLAIDDSGNIFLIGLGSHLIRKITPQGVVTTFAGSGSSGSDNGTGTAASFSGPYDGSFDASGNLFVTDRSNRQIRKITPAGVVTTFATGFDSPTGIAVHKPSGNMYVTDGNTVVRKITPTGVVTILAGSSGMSGDVDDVGTAARFGQLDGIAVDASENVYVSDQTNNKVRKITPTGVVTTFAAGLSFPTGLHFDNQGNLLVGEQFSSSISSITSAGVVTRIAGTGSSGSDDGNALTEATFNVPLDLVVDTAGTIFVVGHLSRKIRKISSTSVLTGNSLNNAGAHNVVLEANDGNGGTVQQIFTINAVAQPTVTLSADNSTINEASGTATLTATLSKVWANDVTVTLGYTGTAVNGTDYNSTASTSITITAGQTSTNAAVIITPIDDADLENDESIIVDITGVTNAKEDGVQQQTITITSDETASLSVNTVTKAENADGGATTDFTYTVTLTGATGAAFSIDYATADIDAVAGTDYTATSGTLNFAGNDGETQQFTVTVNNDDVAEFDETFSVQFSNLQAGGLPITIPSPSIATITNDDTAILTIADVSGNEDDGAITVTVTLDKGVQGGFSVSVSTADGSATVANNDYTAVSLQQISFTGTAGETKTFTVTPTVDTTTEFDETLTVSMQLPQRNGSAVLDASDTATITILNDDLATITIADVSANEDDGPITVTATLDNDIQGGFTIAVSTLDGTATLANNDYTALVSQFVVFTGTAGETQTFTVTPTADTVAEDNETVSIFMQIPARSSSQIVDVSDTATVTILDDDLIPAVITFADIGKTYGDADFTLGATSNSTGTISYSIVAGGTGSASLSGTNNATVSLGNTGTVTIRATLPADGAYDSGTKDITLTIGKATLTVTADDKSKIYGDANPALTVSYSGFQNGDDASVLDTAPTSSTTATMTSDAGDYDIDVTGGSDNNYSFSYVSGTLTINKATLTVTADDQSKIYGDANPAFTITYTGFKGTDDASVLDTASTASTSADVTTGVTITPTIIASGGVDNNYTFSYVTGTLTITQRSITVTADDKTKERATTDPVFTYMTTSGDLVNGDVFTGDLTRDAGEASGSYSINQGALTAGANYDLTFVSGTLTIEDTLAPNPPTITHISDYTCSGDTNMTGDNTLEISGTAEQGSTIEVFQNGVSIGTVTTANSGFFTFDHTGTTLADGTYNFTVTATDTANNTSALSAPLTITINSVDTDGDGLPDFCDPDDDGNGVDDEDEDCDGDGIIDSIDTDNSACTSAITQTKQYGFSPNGDGVNDGWYIENITAYPNSVVQVYSRSGKLVFKKKGYQNDWTGVSNQISNSGTENRLPVGPYLFIIDLGDGTKPTRGWLYINY